MGIRDGRKRSTATRRHQRFHVSNNARFTADFGVVADPESAWRAARERGTCRRGQVSLALTVVPDSGTDALAGLRGSMQIEIAGDGAHSYTFDFTLG